MPSRQALELLQVRQIRSPGQLLRNSSRHLRHLRSLVSYLRSGSGFEFFSELLMARIYSSSYVEMRPFCCTAKGLFYRPIQQGRRKYRESAAMHHGFSDGDAPGRTVEGRRLNAVDRRRQQGTSERRYRVFASRPLLHGPRTPACAAGPREEQRLSRHPR